MSTLKCKMCGGELVFEPEMTVCECEYCGSKQTIPTADNEKKMKLFDRANRLRLNCEFDKAAAVYESIVSEFPEEAEGYWGNLLCAYGIEYVDDPATGNKIPTCHRSSFTCFLDEEDFEQVMENADAVSRSVYREQAKQIEEIRKGIIEVSGKEQPYDIFICYKETAEDGQRTIDSVLAQDVYDALTAKGYRVFFSRISLEDKLGTEYEPYIFAALNSAKVMLAFGTSYDYYNAVWVKNEWSRYLKLMAEDKSKHLIPCYKDIDAYDIPKEFRSLQAQDLGKVGATQDLLRGIDKIMGKQAVGTQTVIGTAPQSTQNPLTERGMMFLEDGEWDKAAEYFERALDANPRDGKAYYGKVLQKYRVTDISSLEKYVIDLDSDKDFERAVKYMQPDAFHAILGSVEKIRLKFCRRQLVSVMSTVVKRMETEAREEEERKRKEARKEAEAEAERMAKLQAEIKSIEAQLKSGKFELTTSEQAEQQRLNQAASKAEEAKNSARQEVEKAETALKQAEQELSTCAEQREVTRLEGEIEAKKKHLATLGIFKGREKKETQANIEALTKALQAAQVKLEEKKKSKLNPLNKQLAEANTRNSTAVENAAKAKEKAGEYRKKKLEEKKAELEKKLSVLRMKTPAVGDFVAIGKYEQGSGVLPIEWLVLDKKDRKLLLISKYALECRKYHEHFADITWENCDLRKWLNNEFLNAAFDGFEQSLIMETRCPADKNPQYDTPPGNATTDKVFLLSIPEAKKYFKSDEDRKAAPTAYAKKQGANADDDFKTAAGEACCWWWLRSPGDDSPYAAYVSRGGSVVDNGDDVAYSEDCIRPALWISLES